MNDMKPSHKKQHILLLIFVIMVSFAAIMPFSSKSEIQTNKPCVDPEDGSQLQQRSQEENNKYQLNCSPDYKKELFKLFILGMVNLDELTAWVLGVDRRLVVLKMMHEKRLIQASGIADSTERSLQNISYAMRELEEHGLIRCLTPEKHTWKKYIPTEKGTEVFEKLKKNHLID
jgi:predicted transcriptional regulator